MSIIGENMCCNFLHIGKYKKILDGVRVQILPLLAIKKENYSKATDLIRIKK